LWLLLAVVVSTAASGMKVPAIFVFGDSTADVGNNNYLPGSSARADFPHNGIVVGRAHLIWGLFTRQCLPGGRPVWFPRAELLLPLPRIPWPLPEGPCTLVPTRR
jgi:hypothetical protein